jgi:hypothetical protein
VSDAARLRRTALLCAGLALAVRLAAALGPGVDPVRRGDAAEYHAYATSLRMDGRYAGPRGDRASRPPGYPAFLAGVYAVAGDSTRAVAVAQSLLGAGTVALLVLCAGALLAPPWPGVVGAAAAVYRGLAEPAVWPLAEGAYAFALALALYALLKGPRAEGRRGAAFGAALAAAALIRPDPLPFAGGALLVGGPLLPLARRARLAALLVLALPFFAWTARNYAVLGRFVPTTTSTGFVAYCGLRIALEERFVSPPRPPFVPDERWDEFERQDAYLAEFRRLWRESSWTQKLKAYAFNVASVLYPFLPEYDWTYMLVLPLWILGLTAARGDPRWGWIAGLTLSSLATYAVFGGPAARYRTAIAPLLLLLGGAGLARLEAAWGRRLLARVAAGWLALHLLVWAFAPSVRRVLLALIW